MIKKKYLYVFNLLFCSTSFAGSAAQTVSEANVLLGVTTIFCFAVLGGYFASKLSQPRVLGELLMGVLIGNIFYYFGSELIMLLREGGASFEIIKSMLHGNILKDAVNTNLVDTAKAQQIYQVLSGNHGLEYINIVYVVDIFSRYGVIFLLFIAGLESSVQELKQTGKAPFYVALIGVFAPMILGFIVAIIMLPTSSLNTDLFIAATLCATSIGITASVLSELNKLNVPESKIILGAAMIDDVLGLMILAVISSIVINGHVEVFSIIRVILTAIIFFSAAVYIGPKFLKKIISIFYHDHSWKSKLNITFLFIMLLSVIASFMELSPIIGAFTAGVILDDSYFARPASKKYKSIHDLLSPLETILTPMFFILIGIQVKIESFFNTQVIIVATCLIIVAIVGKVISGWGASSKMNRLLIGIGMIPRGEVGLVFASIGRNLGVVGDEVFSSIVLMIIVTTFIAPPLLKMQFAKKELC